MTPFDKQKAAQYFIVAWIKNWRLRTYLQAIGVGAMEYENVSKLYPWLPTNISFYAHNTPVQRIAAIVMRSINDKLHDTDDVKKQLLYAKNVELWISDEIKISRREKNERQEVRRERINAQKIGLEYRASKETMRRGNGHHWNVVK